MPRSVLLQLARDSIAEVLQAQRTIDKELLLTEHPLLHQKVLTHINIYLDNELRGSAHSTSPDRTLIEDIIHNAKCSAFEDTRFTALSTSEYLHCEIEIILHTSEGEIREKDGAIIKNDTAQLETILRKN